MYYSIEKQRIIYQKKKRKLMKILKYFFSLIVKLDLFPAQALLRYKNRENKATQTGGCVSVLFVVILIFVFSSTAISMIRKQQIYVTQYTQIEQDPSPVQINNTNLFLAIGTVYPNYFQQNNNYFSYELVHLSYNNGTLKSTTNIKMNICTQTILQQYFPDFKQMYQKLQLSNFLCLPQGFRFNISGKQTNRIFQYLRFRLKMCVNDCVDNQEIKDFKELKAQFYVDNYFINKLLNPNSHNPVSLYYQDRLFQNINGNSLKIANIYASQYNILTDQSFILPSFSDNSQKGIYFKRSQIEHVVLPFINDTYIELNIFKSDQKLYVNRSFDKIDDLLSYVGGLFGIFAVALRFIIRKYNKLCFELELSNKLFKTQQTVKDIQLDKVNQQNKRNQTINQQKQQKKNPALTYNFLKFIQYVFSFIYFLLFPSSNWPKMKKMKQKIQQTQNCINVDTLVQKFLLYDQYLKCYFTQNQFTLLLLQQKFTVQDCMQKRLQVYQATQDQNQITGQVKLYQNSPKIQVENVDFIKDYQDKQIQNRKKVFDAIQDLKRKAQYGDIISLKILENVRQDIFQQYQSNGIYTKNRRYFSYARKITKRSLSKISCDNSNNDQINQQS